MQTYYAPAGRAGFDVLQKLIRMVSSSPVVSVLLQTMSGLLAVLDERRQIIALNDAFLASIGINDPYEALGLRPGEAVRCVHAADMPGGCGTSKHCASCGAAIAIVTSQQQHVPCERICSLARHADGGQLEACFLVKASPLTLEGDRFTVLAMQDITAQQQRASLERIFFHDIQNIITSLLAAGQLFEFEDEKEIRKLGGNILQLSTRLAKEVAIQKKLLQRELSEYEVTLQSLPVPSIIKHLQEIYTFHDASKGKMLEVSDEIPRISVMSDYSLLMRVLSNLITNAFEATAAGGVVRLGVSEDAASVLFHVWNASCIPEEVGLRVFQKYFSTKNESGRGLGTYAVKLFTEQYLGGAVGFTSDEKKGTTFTLRIRIA